MAKGPHANPKSPYWQHREPLRCPKRHWMTWLGSVFWICGTCHTIYVQEKPRGADHG